MQINKDLRVTDGAYYNLDLDTIAKNGIYSTDEIVVGRWIDGKPIYRKVYYNGNYSQAAKSTKDISFSLPNFKTLVSAYGSITAGDGVFNEFPIPWANATGMEYSASFGGITSTGFKITTGSGTVWSNYKVYIVFEYTKITD